MTDSATILKELSELGSSLGDLKVPDTYSVPEGYFDSLSTTVMARIKALEATSVDEEIAYLSPLLSNINRTNVYKVPAGYFEELLNSVPSVIRNEESAIDEISELSPLLSDLKNKNPYTVPQGYFEELQPQVSAPKVKGKVVSMSRRIMQYAAAAVITGILTTFTIILLDNSQLDPTKDPHAWVQKKVVKKVDEAQVEELVTLADDDVNYNGATASQLKEKDEVKELMKDVSEEEIQSFLNETSSAAEDELILN